MSDFSDVLPVETISVGEQFDDSDAFSSFLVDYQKRTYQQFIKHKSDYRKTKDGKTIQGQYDRLILRCHRGPQQPTKSTGARPFQQTYKNDCPVQIKLSFHTKQNKLCVSAVHLGHNHELIPENFALLPPQRRLDPVEKERAKELLSIGTLSAAAVRNALSVQAGKRIQAKQIHNIRTAEEVTKRAGRSTLDVLKSVIEEARTKEKNLIVRSHSNPATKELEVILFVTPKMKQSYAL